MNISFYNEYWGHENSYLRDDLLPTIKAVEPEILKEIPEAASAIPAGCGSNAVVLNLQNGSVLRISREELRELPKTERVNQRIWGKRMEEHDLTLEVYPFLHAPIEDDEKEDFINILEKEGFAIEDGHRYNFGKDFEGNIKALDPEAIYYN